MSMYLHETNKRLLRQTIQSSPLFYKSEVNWTWFTNIIQTLDRQYPHVFNPQDLNQINRETIVYMIQDMKTHISAKTHAQQHHAGFLVGVLDKNEGGAFSRWRWSIGIHLQPVRCHSPRTRIPVPTSPATKQNEGYIADQTAPSN